MGLQLSLVHVVNNANQKHIWVVPAAWTCLVPRHLIPQKIGLHIVETVALDLADLNVIRSSPRLSNLWSPFGNIGISPVANGVMHFVARGFYCICHSCVAFDIGLARLVAIIILKVVKPPVSISLRVDLLEAKTTRIKLCTCSGACRRINSRLQALAVDVIDDILHTIGELDWVRIHFIIRCIPGSTLPAVINQDIVETEFGKSTAHQQVRLILDDFSRYIALERVQGTPSHLWHSSKLVS